MQNTIKILIDLKKEMYRFDQAQQGDDVILDITLLENGVAKDLTGETVELIYINANNTVASVTGDNIVVSGSNVKITCPTDCTRSYGIAKFQLKITNTYQVSTFPIALTIVPGVDQGQQISQNISTILEDLTAKNIESNETLDSLNEWVATHGDIVDIDTRLTNAESTIIDHTSQLADIENQKSKDLSSLFQKHGFTSVITGDSLSYNRYDYDNNARENAYDCQVGMLSWSFMLRDAIHRNDPNFIDIEKLKISTALNTSIKYNATSPYATQFNGRFLYFRDNQVGQEINIYYQPTVSSKAIIYMSSVPTSTCCKFDVYVDDVFVKTVDNNGTEKLFQGYELIYIELTMDRYTEHKITLKNFIQTATVPDTSGYYEVLLYGIGSKYSPVHLTGSGGKTAEWLNANLQDRVLKYNPDFVTIIIGANDRVSTTVENFNTNLSQMINKIRTQNPKCEILLLSCTSSINPSNPSENSSSYVADEESYKFINVMRNIAMNNKCYFLDLINMFKNVPISDWRFDNVHMTKYGNKILCDNIVKTIMPNSLHNKKFINSDLYYFGSTSFDIEKNKASAFMSINSSKIVTIANTYGDKIIKSALMNGDYKIKIYLKYGIPYVNLMSNSFLQYGSISMPIFTRFNYYGYENGNLYLEYYLFKYDNTGQLVVISASDFTNNASSFKFILNIN